MEDLGVEGSLAFLGGLVQRGVKVGRKAQRGLYEIFLIAHFGVSIMEAFTGMYSASVMEAISDLA